MAKKTILYKDPQNDDFANTSLKKTTVAPDFPFASTGPVWRLCEFVLYRLIATPIVWLIAKVGFGLRVKNRRAIRSLRRTGYFMYGNHTQGMMDAYTPSLVSFPKHTHILVGSQAVSAPVLRTLVRLLGGIPIPGGVNGMSAFMDALSLRIDQKRVVTVYPEAHIWPWYTGIRPFSEVSFTYPVRQGVPAVAFVTTYRRRKVFSKLPPCLTVTLSEPFFADASLSEREATKELRDRVYDFMCREAAKPGNYAYYEYVQSAKEDAPGA